MKRVIIVGGGAAGFFGAIAAAEVDGSLEVLILEKGPQFLQKVRISGGGRCNVTHACFDVRDLTGRYPRGQRELLGPYHRFQARDTVEWFETRGVRLKAEEDGRMFPTTDSSQTIIDCLIGQADSAGIKRRTNAGVAAISRKERGGFEVVLESGERLSCDAVLQAIGGCRTPALGDLAVGLGHTLEAPVPSLFTFHVELPWVRGLAGLVVDPVELSIPGTKLLEEGPLLFTHWGLSGPVVLRLSAWGARTLHAMEYRFPLRITWSKLAEDKVRAELQRNTQEQGSRKVTNTPVAGLPTRLWAELVKQAVAPDRRWSQVTKAENQKLIELLMRTELPVSGKSLNKDEFVTCGGIRLSEVNFKTMESKICPGLFFAGEVLDIDGITGGFNFQAAWTTGWIAGRSIAERLG